MQYTAPATAPPQRDVASTLPTYTQPLVSERITETNYSGLLTNWRVNSSYSQLEQYTNFLRSFHPSTLAEKEFAQQAATFLLPYMVSRLALDDARASKNDPDFTTSEFHAYKRKKNDCFTYWCRLVDRVKKCEGEDCTIYELARGITYSSKNGIPVGAPAQLPALREDNDIFLSSQSYDLGQMKKGFALQAGDFVKVNHSQSGHNHWGVVVEVKGQLMLVSRRKKSIDIEPLEKFTAFASQIEVRRLGGFSGYNQHFDVAMKEEGNRKRNLAKNKPPTFSITLAAGPEPDPVIPVKLSQARKSG